jgi:HD domain-containing protein
MNSPPQAEIRETFEEANPHALEMIVDAAEKHAIVASEDIYDERNVKLWSAGQPVTRSLQQRLLERRLKRPLEACLRAQDGVTIVDLLNAADEFLASDHALAQTAKPYAADLAREIQQLPLHSVVQLLLTAVRSSTPNVFEHAVRGMVLAGAMAASAKKDSYFVRLALLGGLLHDIGEMYVNPEYLAASHLLSPEDYRYVVAHPRIGETMLISQTDYPDALARAIGEHHERLDGNGYPKQIIKDKISPLGQLLMVVETTLGISSATHNPLSRASFALRLVPGEYPLPWVGFIAKAAQDAKEDLAATAAAEPPGAAEALEGINAKLAAGLAKAKELTTAAPTSGARDVAGKALHLLNRLRAGWNGMGLWSTGEEDEPVDLQFERLMARRELRYRLRYVQRECLWPEKTLGAAELQPLQPLWAALE